MLQLDLYIREAIDFLKTCSFKIDYFREYMEHKQRQFQNTFTVYVWDNEYYLHLNGCYHPRDTKIHITSIDTNTDIIFDRYILKDHPKTLNMYSIRTDNYKSLLNQYPEYNDLIRNIIYPVLTNADSVISSYSNITIPITSVDDGTTINFDRGGLLEHPLTVSLYREQAIAYMNFVPTLAIPVAPSSDYTVLIANHPQDYIDAVLFPVVDTDFIVTSKDMTLLTYATGILHPNEETNIVNKLRDYLEMIRERWVVKEFIYEEYYFASQVMIIFQLLLLQILTMRFNNIRTNEVHKYHILEYLKSHGLGGYTDMLDNQQELFLYKNINYINKNKGKTSNLKLLADNLLSKQRVSLRTKSILQSTSNSTDDCNTTPHIISEDLSSTVTPLQNATGLIEPLNAVVFREYINKLEPIYSPKVIDNQTFNLRHSRNSYIKTKLVTLEHANSDASFSNLYFTFATHTLMRKLKDNEINYTATVPLTSDGFQLVLTASEMIALIMYGLGKLAILKDTSNNAYPKVSYEGIINIPTTMTVFMTYNKVLPDVSNLNVYHRGSTSTQIATYSKLTSLLDTTSILDKLDNPVTGVPRNIIHNNAVSLVNDIDSQFEVLRNQLLNLYVSSDMYIHDAWTVLIKQLLHKETLTVDLVPGYTTYEDWFLANPTMGDIVREIDGLSTTTEVYSTMINNLLNALYPINLTGSRYNTGLSDKQYVKMRQLFEQLSSYNIAFIDTDSINNSELPATGISIGTFNESLTEEIIFKGFDPELTMTSAIQDITDIDNNDYYIKNKSNYNDVIPYIRQTENPIIKNIATQRDYTYVPISMTATQIYTP